MQKEKISVKNKWDKGDTVIINGKSGVIKVLDTINNKVMVEHQEMDVNETYNRNYSMNDLPPYPTPQPEPPTKKPKPPAQKPGGIPTFEVGHKRSSYGGNGPTLEIIAITDDGKYECEVTVTGGNKYKHIFDGKRVSTWGNAVVETPPSTGPAPDALRIHEVTSQKPATPPATEKPKNGASFLKYLHK